MILDAPGAARRALHLASSRYPDQSRRAFAQKLIVPTIEPRFSIERARKCFTIGSCFARNVEEILERQGVRLPTREFASPRSEWPWRKNGLLNEYNPGTITQRIVWALKKEPFSEETLIETPRGVIDLLLPASTYVDDVSRARAVERRRQIDAVYEHLSSSDLVLLTLGTIEAWYDRRTELYLNRKPPSTALDRWPERYLFRRLDFAETRALLEEAITGLVASGVERILVSVSPVPLNTTFSGCDAYTANVYSKSVLRACAEDLLRHPQVDYLPSYEMVMSGGPNAFGPDNMHVLEEVVEQVIQSLLSAYIHD